MAQSGYTPIQIYYSTTGAAAPVAGNLANGELAINIADGKLYYKDSGGSVQIIATKAGASGDVVGPASATDNAIVRFDGTTGKLVQDSSITVADSGTAIVSASATLAVFNTTSTTVNAFGAATTLNIGNSGGTNTILGISNFSQGVNGTLGATTPAAATVTTLNTSGAVTMTRTTNDNTLSIVNATGASARGNILFQGTTAGSVSKNAYVGINVFSADAALDICSDIAIYDWVAGSKIVTTSSTGLAVTGKGYFSGDFAVGGVDSGTNYGANRLLTYTSTGGTTGFTAHVSMGNNTSSKGKHYFYTASSNFSVFDLPVVITSAGLDVTGVITATMANATYITAQENAINQVTGYRILSANGSTVNAIFSSNTATGEVKFGGTAANYFPTFYANNAEKMRIHVSGGVSINNTTDPGAGNLSVTGTLSATKATAGDAAVFTNGGATPKAVYVYTDATFSGIFSLGSAVGGANAYFWNNVTDVHNWQINGLGTRMNLSSTGLAVTGTLSATTGAAVGGATAGAGGLAFPATAVAVADANTLDDYEEGTWTPSLGGNTTYTTQSGVYVKIGRMVWIRFTVRVNVIGTGSGSGAFSGLPFTSATFGGALRGCALSVCYFDTLTSNQVFVSCGVNDGATTLQCTALAAAGTAMSGAAALTGSGTGIEIAGCYQI